MTDFERWKTLLGKQVRVTIQHQSGDLTTGGDNEIRNAVIVTGQLLAFGDGGDFEILEEDGFVHYCWPLLEMEEI